MLSRRIKSILRTNIRSFSIRPDTEPVKNFRTQENNPLNHNKSHCGQYYTVNPEIKNVVFKHGGFPRVFQKQAKTFTECCVMIREPALELMDLISKCDLSKPVNRFVLYGYNGTGKSLTMAHIIHYMFESGYFLVHIPWVPEWYNRVLDSKEMVNSPTREGFVDTPVDAASWLIHFKTQNQNILKNENLVTSKEYIWSKRENTPAGSHIMELIDLGINRIKYATDIVVILMDEIKILSNKKIIKTFVAIDGFNCIYNSKTHLKTNTKRDVKPEEVTLTQAILNITKNDWCNGIVLLAVDQIASSYEKETYFPRHLLGKKGFEHLDPFVPIETVNYDDKEFLSCMSYYRDRMWVRGHPEAETELSFTTGKNPYMLMHYTIPL